MIYRYQNTGKIKGGIQLATPHATRVLRKAIEMGALRFKTRIIKEGERVDIIAGEELGDARMWWIIAACSNIGWALQVPSGTKLLVPTHIADVNALIG